MTASIFNTEIDQGRFCTSHSIPSGWKRERDRLTGCSAAMMIRQDYDDPRQRHPDPASGGGLSMGGVAGTIDISIESSATPTLCQGKYVYDLKVFDSLSRQIRSNT